MSDKLRKEFEKEMKMKSTISYGGPEIIGRFEGQYTLWIESALLRERELWVKVWNSREGCRKELQTANDRIKELEARIEAMRCAQTALATQRSEAMSESFKKYLKENDLGNPSDWREEGEFWDMGRDSILTELEREVEERVKNHNDVSLEEQVHGHTTARLMSDCYAIEGKALLTLIRSKKGGGK
jgi:hypothetical protein